MVDGILPGKRVWALFGAACLILLGYIGRVGFAAARGRYALEATQRVALKLRLDILRQLDQLSADYHENTLVGESCYPLAESVEEISAFGAEVVPTLLRIMTMAVAALAIMWELNRWMTLSVLPIIPIFYVTRTLFRQRIQDAAESVQGERSIWAAFGIMRLDQRHQLRPRHHQLHLFQKLCTPRLLRVPLEPVGHRQCPLLESALHPATL